MFTYRPVFEVPLLVVTEVRSRGILFGSMTRIGSTYRETN